MSKNIVYFTITIISIALLSVIGFQVLWYQNGYRLHEQLYNQSIQTALKDVVTELENREAANVITNRLEFLEVEPSVRVIKNVNPHKSNTRELSKSIVLPGEHDSLPQVIFNKIEAIQLDTHRINQLKQIHALESSVMVISDQQIDSNQLHKIMVRINKPGVDKRPDKHAKREKVTVIEDNGTTEGLIKQKLDDVLNKLVKELEWKDSSLMSRINKDTLAVVIKQSLAQQGIYSHFSFAVYTDSVIPEIIDTPSYRIALFPNDLHKRSVFLQVLVPDGKLNIKQQMYGQVAGSVVFTLILLFAFTYSIYVMLKQKKLAEIKNDFINNMTHELKTPISTISLAADTIKNELTLMDREKTIRYASIIQEENSRMNAQVEKVLQLALTDKSDFSIKKEDCYFHDIIDSCLQKFKLITEAENRKIRLELQATKDHVKGDSFHLQHAIANIIDNALKYSTPSSEVVIRTKNEENQFCLSIKDSGIGMNKEVQRKIFDKFYRAQSGNLHDVKGFGIGLSYVKNIIDAHKGNIFISSEPGKGTTFTITLQQNI